MRGIKKFINDTNADAVVEAAILFPIIIMIFAALVLLSMYLPTRAALQRATQYAATALATEKSDTWLYFDEKTTSYKWKTQKSQLDNVYVALFNSFKAGGDKTKAETIVKNAENSAISVKSGKLEVKYAVVNYIVYQEIVVEATRVIPAGVNLSFIGFPKEITVTVASTAVVQNGDEFVRDIDLAVDFAKYIGGKFGLNKESGKNSNIVKKVLGW